MNTDGSCGHVRSDTLSLEAFGTLTASHPRLYQELKVTLALSTDYGIVISQLNLSPNLCRLRQGRDANTNHGY